MVPGVGEVFDGANAAIYAARGDTLNAALSASAMIPMAGNAATAAKLGAKYGDEAVGAAKALDTVACPNSFRADTPVATASGPQPISTLAKGDTVLAWDAPSGQTASYTITATISHIDAEIVHLTIAGERLETTREHPFFVVGQGWVPAEDLQVGAAIWRYDRQVGQVEYRAVEARTQRMYNLTVATAHTFFVGDGQWLVHNCGGDAFAPATKVLNEAIDGLSNFSNSQRNKISTMVGAVDTKTGMTTVGIKRSGECIGQCAEDIAVAQLGADPQDVLFTPAYRPRTASNIPVCPRCQTKYNRSQFRPDAEFDRD